MLAIDNILASISPLLDTLESLIRKESYSPSARLPQPPNSHRSIRQKATTKDVDTLQMQLQSISAIVDKTQRAERCLKAHYASVNNSLAPVMVLPIEILQCIFNMAVHTRDTKASCPAEISAVCRYWRDIAASYGRLWTQIRVDAEELSKVKTLATRTRGLPIELDIQWKPKENDAWMYDNEQMPRLSSLRMALTWDRNFTPLRLLEDAKMDFSALRLLDLRMDQSRYQGPSLPCISLEHIKAPSLRIFKIDDIEITSMPDTHFHLTTLSISWSVMRYTLFYQFLAGSPQLEQVDIHFTIFLDDVNSSNVPYDAHSLILPSLKRFNFTVGCYEDFKDVLTTVTAPNLEELWLELDTATGDGWEPHECARILQPFLSARSLTRLGLVSLRPVIREFIKILSPRYPSHPKPNQNHLRSLESLTLQAVIPQDDDAEEAETSAHLQDLILPLSTTPHRLRELHLSASLVGNTQFYDWLKRQMVKFTIIGNHPMGW